MMLVRMALAEERKVILDMAKANVAETLKEPFRRGRVGALFTSYLRRANPTFFVAEKDRQVVGFLMARMCDHDYRDGFYTTQSALYVKPEFRGSTASLRLMKHLIVWSKKIGADAIDGGNDNGFQSDRTKRFLEHMGFRMTGYAMRKDLETAGE